MAGSGASGTVEPVTDEPVPFSPFPPPSAPPAWDAATVPALQPARRLHELGPHLVLGTSIVGAASILFAAVLLGVALVAFHTPPLVAVASATGAAVLAVAFAVGVVAWSRSGRTFHPLAVPALALVFSGAVGLGAVATGSHYDGQFHHDRLSPVARQAELIESRVSSEFSSAPASLRDDAPAAGRWLQHRIAETPGVESAPTRSAIALPDGGTRLVVHAYLGPGPVGTNCVAITVQLPSGAITAAPLPTPC